MREKVVFLDRDGVINRDSSDFIKSVAEFEFLPRSLDALRLLTKNGFRVILITNQFTTRKIYKSINLMKLTIVI